uniref:Rho3 GTP binding protein n=1 Tax=Mycosarcoma maydis TaxID=5270 RepID=Q8NJW3_MYCMD|nr:Rho3 GTP binding protein [Ustilago maydis]
MTLCGIVHDAQRESHRIARKVLVFGDGASGKTSLLFVFVRHEFPQTSPTVFENYTHIQHTHTGLAVELTLWDTAGQEEFDKLRSLSYADTDVVLLCFSVDNPVSLQNVESRWIAEIRHHCPAVKIMLVALKCDLREPRNPRTLSYNHGLDVAKRINACRYLECSAKSNRGVTECFTELASVAANVRPHPHSRACTIA